MIDIAIVGAGPAGLAAGIYGARAGHNVTIFEELVPGGQLSSIDKLENYPGFAEGVGGYEIALSMKDQAERLGATIAYDRVDALRIGGEGEAPFVLSTSAGTVGARSVIAATGAKPKPKPLHAQGVEELVGKGVSYCATCDGAFFRGRDVVVVGGGDTAVADAIYLAKLARQVHLVHRRDTLSANPRAVGRMEQLENVTVHWNSQLVAAEAEGGVLSGATIEPADGTPGARETIPAAALFIAIGNMPASAWLGDAVERDAKGFIVTHDTVFTSTPGIFAAGDVRTTPMRQVVTATADGALAAEAAGKFLR